jgi:hypothetical protein
MGNSIRQWYASKACKANYIFWRLAVSSNLRLSGSGLNSGNWMTGHFRTRLSWTLQDLKLFTHLMRLQTWIAHHLTQCVTWIYGTFDFDWLPELFLSALVRFVAYSLLIILYMAPLASKSFNSMMAVPRDYSHSKSDRNKGMITVGKRISPFPSALSAILLPLESVQPCVEFCWKVLSGKTFWAMKLNYLVCWSPLFYSSNPSAKSTGQSCLGPLWRLGNCWIYKVTIGGSSSCHQYHH